MDPVGSVSEKPGPPHDGELSKAIAFLQLP